MIPIGWHGKLPTVGDFATRRLDADFVQHWDDWLSDGLERLRQARPGGWLDDYLASPLWRFLLLPGALPGPLSDQTWTGVLMPSVDRVGRYYPLTLAAPLPGWPGDDAEAQALWSWLLRLEEAAADALHEDWSIEALERELARVGGVPALRGRLPALGPAPDATAVQTVALTGGAQAAGFFAVEAAIAAEATVRGRCFWYSQADLAAPRFLCSQGLGRAGLVAALFA